MLCEYVNGGQMLDYIISHGKLKEKQARKFSRQIASALDYCHRNSIVHRDLKIENILISKTGDIKIIDFGLSNLFAPRTHLKTFCGSLYFAAPELLQARAYTGPEVDIWSFGIVLYVLVCGKVPFDDQSMPALHAKIKKGLVDYPNWLSSECKHLLSRMLVTDPKQRATMLEVMSHPWMTKGYNGPPDNHLPPREPLTLPLDSDVVNAMTGFNFGPPDSIKAQLVRTIESEEYQRAVRLYQREKELPQPAKDVEKKRGFGFDFYKRRNSGNSRDTLTAPSSEALQLGNDPLNAFSPLVSIYYLVREKQDRDRAERNPGVQSTPKEKPPIPEITPPQEAHTNTAAYEMPASRDGQQSRAASMRAKSLGHARRESIQQRRLRREEAREANVPEETDQEQGDQSGVSTDSVSTTSTKNVTEIRADIKRVLKGLGVDYIEIKGGFTCKHTPSIDLKRVQDPPGSPGQAPPGHRRRFSLGGVRGGDRERDDLPSTDRGPSTPRGTGRNGADSYSNSDVSIDSVSREAGGSSRRVPGETSTHVQSDLGGNMVLEFEIFIVKVPLLSLHGIQFKRLVGNTWQYKNMADQVLRELRL
ncbi:Protein kinase kin1 [Colletotrichum sp. SAR 10_99]|nr:Protein kinase kin1 [Colletotrichum sp. SAR 10_96]KAI8271367.1 Protein kinase kin1 [Colletotrichum sp. SAR 10_98]KAJ5013282.1 Protein kinase kin1 [Colletotrichum sp. SAR 10_99]